MKRRKGPLQPRPASAATGTSEASGERKTLRMPDFFFLFLCTYYAYFSGLFKITGIFLQILKYFRFVLAKRSYRKYTVLEQHYLQHPVTVMKVFCRADSQSIC